MSTAVLDRPGPSGPPPGGPISAGGGNAMRKVSLRGLMSHKMRFLLTLLAVTLGTAFVAGSFVLTNALGKSIDGIVGGTVVDTDVVIQPKSDTSDGLSLSLEKKLRGVNGVAAVQPEVSQMVSLIGSNGKVVSTGGAPTQGLAWTEGADNASAKNKLVAGRAPRATNEVAINSDGLEKAGLKVGDTTKVALPKRGLVKVKVVGEYSFDFASGGYIGVLFTQQQARQEFVQGNAVPMFYVRGDDGVSQDDLRSRVASVLPATAEAETQKAFLDDAGKSVAQGVKVFQTVLLVFGIIGLVVGASLIYITFSMVIAQRLRELALLRAIGASRGQILRSVLVEGLLVGLAGSVLGLLVGWALGWGMMRLLGSRMGVPMGSANLPVAGIITTLALGTGITMISALIPAVRAGSTSPIEAMGGQFATPRVGRARVISAVVMLLLVAGLTVAAVTSGSKPLLGLAFFLALVTSLVASPIIAPLVFAIFRPLTRLTPIGRLAHGNAVRNPKRTAATAAALALGLALISGSALMASSFKSTLTDAVNKGQNWEYTVAGQQGRPIPPYMVREVVAAPEAAAVAQISSASLPLKDGDQSVVSVRGDFNRSFDPQMVSGSGELGPDTLLVNEDIASGRHWKAGDQVTVNAPSGVRRTLTVGGVMKSGGLLDPAVVSSSVGDVFSTPERRAPFWMFITPKDGADKGALRSTLDRATASDPTVTVQDKKEFTKSFTSQIDVLLAILYGLLGLSVAISILGIVNTLALSVVERVRELGMMRAIGAQRAQIRRMITVESVLICIYGALVGLGIGILFGWLFVGQLADQGVTSRVIPWDQIGISFLAAILVGLVAAVWPAIKASRTKPLEAIAEG